MLWVHLNDLGELVKIQMAAPSLELSFSRSGAGLQRMWDSSKFSGDTAANMSSLQTQSIATHPMLQRKSRLAREVGPKGRRKAVIPRRKKCRSRGG